MHPANFVFLVELEFLYIGQAGLEPPTSGDPPTSASQSVGITGVSHRARPILLDFLRQDLALAGVPWCDHFTAALTCWAQVIFPPQPPK